MIRKHKGSFVSCWYFCWREATLKGTTKEVAADTICSTNRAQIKQQGYLTGTFKSIPCPQPCVTVYIGLPAATVRCQGFWPPHLTKQSIWMRVHCVSIPVGNASRCTPVTSQSSGFVLLSRYCSGVSTKGNTLVDTHYRCLKIKKVQSGGDENLQTYFGKETWRI